MSDGKHTPGTWAAEWTTRDIANGVRNATTYGWHVGIPDTDSTICVVEDCRACDADQDRRRADATMIAAAPDLLAACELADMLIDVFIRMTAPRDFNPNLVQDINDTQSALSNAIAKARGD